jgi:neurofibromin 1
MLCALGGCCLNDESERKQQLQMAIEKFIGEIFELLVCDNVIVREAVRDILANELSVGMQPLLAAKLSLTALTEDSNIEMPLNDKTTFLIDQAITILKQITERCDNNEDMVSINVSALVLSYVKYVARLAKNSAAAIRVKSKLCGLIEVIIFKNEYLQIREEIKFRNRLLETFVEWTSDSLTLLDVQNSSEDELLKARKKFRQLDVLCLKAMAALLQQLPLQPPEILLDGENLVEKRERLFDKYFQFFIKLMKRCRVEEALSINRQVDKVSQFNAFCFTVDSI